MQIKLVEVRDRATFIPAMALAIVFALPAQAGRYCDLVRQAIIQDNSSTVVEACDDASEPELVVGVWHITPGDQMLAYFEIPKRLVDGRNYTASAERICVPLYRGYDTNGVPGVLEAQLCHSTGGYRRWCATFNGCLREGETMSEHFGFVRNDSEKPMDAAGAHKCQKMEDACAAELGRPARKVD